jgi:metabotropic X receptor
VLLADKNICIAVKERLVKDSGVAGDDSYNGIVLKLASKPNAKGSIHYTITPLLYITYMYIPCVL